MFRCPFLFLVVIAIIVGDLAADQQSLVKGRSLHQAGRLVEAEKLLAESLAAIDAGELPRNQLGQCLSPLIEIYRTWGRNEQALAAAERYQKFLRAQTSNDRNRRDKTLAETALTIGDLQSALGRYEEAEKAVAEAAALNGKSTDPLAKLKIQVRLARIAEARENADEAAARWQGVASTAADAVTAIEAGKLAAKSLPDCLSALASSNLVLHNFDAAIAAQRKLRTYYVQQKDITAAIRATAELARCYSLTRDYSTALSLLNEALQQTPLSPPQKEGSKVRGTADAELRGDLFSGRAAIAMSQGRRSAAVSDFKQAAAEYENILQASPAPADAHRMALLGKLQSVYQQAGEHLLAITAAAGLIKLRQARLGEEHPQTIAALTDLGALYGATGDYERAEPLLTGALDHWRRRKPAQPLQVARVLNDLAVVERATGSFAEAEKLFGESLAIRQKALKPDDLRLAYSLSNLASTLVARGEYARAIVLYQQSIGIYQKRGPGAGDALSGALLNIAMAYKSQGQLAKAGDYCRQALDAYSQVFGGDSPGAIALYNALASLNIATGNLQEAASYNARSLKIIEANSLAEEAVAASALHHQATIEYLRDDLGGAETHWLAALKIQEAGGQTAAMARTLNYLARIATLKKSSAKAEPLYRRALKLQQEAQAFPTVHYLTYCNLAEIAHQRGETDEAIELVRQAVDLIETPRAGTTGAEGERAEFFAQYSSAFDLLMAWNLEAGRIDEAFTCAERGRNRTFLDQLTLAGIDLRETVTGPEGDKLRERERNLRTAIGTTRSRAAVAKAQTVSPSRGDNRSFEQMTKELSQLQTDYAQVWADIRSASSLYRQQLARDSKHSSLAETRAYLQKNKAVMLFYYLGSKNSYLLVIDGTSRGRGSPSRDDNSESRRDSPTDVQVVHLAIPEALTGVFSVAAGPLTRTVAVQLVNQYLQDLRDRKGGRGLAGIVSSPKGVEAANGGTALAEVLLPRSVRTQIAGQVPATVIIVPDGALHQLPFESLLLESGKKTRYVLDTFPPIAYAPSAAILLNLESRSLSLPLGEGRGEGVLTVGNPQYQQPASSAETTVAVASRDAYVDLGGALPLLPGTSKECARVAAAFPRQVTLLEGAAATEQNVRSKIVGRRYLHLAAHGLVDQRNDNLFGAIALTPPGPQKVSGTVFHSDPQSGAGLTERTERVPDTFIGTSENDGFLSLHEIHALNLSGCELAVLSACQTNVGPDRPLEAGSTLAQAFLAAGAKRVVCSHWNVDDASTAELMGAFFTALARTKDRDTPTYAAALHEARKTVRANSQWSAPYYWAPFVLIGPE